MGGENLSRDAPRTHRGWSAGLISETRAAYDPTTSSRIAQIPRQVWPFGPAGPGPAALAASLLDGEWRAARAGAQVLDALARQAAR